MRRIRQILDKRRLKLRNERSQAFPAFGYQQNDSAQRLDFDRSLNNFGVQIDKNKEKEEQKERQ